MGQQSDRPEEVERTGKMWAELQAWLAKTGAKIPLPNPEYQQAWAKQDRKRAEALKSQLEKEHATILEPDWKPNKNWWQSLQTAD